MRTTSNSRYEHDNDPAQGAGAFLLEIVKVFVLALVIIFPVRVFLFQPFFVQGASMEPNYHDGEYLIVNEWGYKHTNIGFGARPLVSVEPFRQLDRGDVVVFRYPKNPSQFFVKRVIGLPGETVKVEDNHITIVNDTYLEGVILDESLYLDSKERTDGTMEISLKEDEYFVLGDNRSHSHDSRSWGPLQEDLVMGKAVFRAWPLSRFGFAS
jgi:signal peptidase I